MGRLKRSPLCHSCPLAIHVNQVTKEAMVAYFRIEKCPDNAPCQIITDRTHKQCQYYILLRIRIAQSWYCSLLRMRITSTHHRAHRLWQSNHFANWRSYLCHPAGRHSMCQKVFNGNRHFAGKLVTTSIFCPIKNNCFLFIPDMACTHWIMSSRINRLILQHCWILKSNCSHGVH